MITMAADFDLYLIQRNSRGCMSAVRKEVNSEVHATFAIAAMGGQSCGLLSPEDRKRYAIFSAVP